MLDQFRELVGRLEDRESGWVARRDAAEVLGKLAQGALMALQSHRNDPDMDVRLQVERSMDAITALLPVRAKSRQEPTLRDLAVFCERAPARIVEPHENGFVVTVRLANERTQKVYIMPHDTRDKRRMVQVYTFCGEVNPQVFEWLLRTNSRIANGAFTLLPGKGGPDRMALLHNIPRANATPEVVKLSVKELAYYGDKLERHMGSDDAF